MSKLRRLMSQTPWPNGPIESRSRHETIVETIAAMLISRITDDDVRIAQSQIRAIVDHLGPTQALAISRRAQSFAAFIAATQRIIPRGYHVFIRPDVLRRLEHKAEHGCD